MLSVWFMKLYKNLTFKSYKLNKLLMNENIGMINMARGDRKDGRRIYPENPENILMPYLMPNRHESEVYLNQNIDITEMME